MKSALFFFVLSILNPRAFAEYRAYQYVVIDRVSEDETASNVVVSTYDPRTYISYHGGGSLITVDLLRTWICPGHTGKKSICPSPYAELPEEFLK